VPTSKNTDVEALFGALFEPGIVVRTVTVNGASTSTGAIASNALFVGVQIADVLVGGPADTTGPAVQLVPFRPAKPPPPVAVLLRTEKFAARLVPAALDESDIAPVIVTETELIKIPSSNVPLAGQVKTRSAPIIPPVIAVWSVGVHARSAA
jgi:hypothetical protein